jgi:8-oxo-dGTP pyrophosphatase MutT (NUDIX family)
MSSPSPSTSTTIPRVVSTKRVAATKWLALDTYTWIDQEGRERFWDVAVRTTGSSLTTTTTSADAVIIVPILQSKTNNPLMSLETLLVEQFRPPLQQAVLEFPAGLIDPGEDVTQTAIRELREETGYLGTVSTLNSVVSRRLAMSPGMISESVHVVVVDVDLDLPENQGKEGKQMTSREEEGEFCIVHRVPLTQGLKQMLDDDHNALPLAGLYLFALGFEMGSRNKGHESK